MPPAAIAVGMIGANVAGSALSSAAANKGPRPIFKDVNQQYLNLVGGPGGMGATSAGTLQDMIKTGMPTDVGPAFEALVNAKQRFVGQGRENIAEMFGASGLRYSTPLMSSLVDYESQVSADFMSILAEYTRQAQEAARQRQLMASQFGWEAFSAPALALTKPKQSTLGAGLSGGLNALQQVMLLKSLGLFGR